MTENSSNIKWDVAIIGGGPAGLSAALVLGRARRRVIVFDHGQPRNYASHAVHGYLGLDGIAPHELRERGRNQASAYGVQFVDEKVVAGRCRANDGDVSRGFELQTATQTIRARMVLLATGLIDELPDIPGIRELYGSSVHHCPYCDGWEHRDQRLVAFGPGISAAKLALELRAWSEHVTACSHGEPVPEPAREKLVERGITWREERVRSLQCEDGKLIAVQFAATPPLECDALFFSADKYQRSPLPEMLGCELDENGLVRTEKKQHTCVRGLYLAGDADGDVQFAIVAAAEGAIAATAIHTALLKEDAKTTPSWARS